MRRRLLTNRRVSLMTPETMAEIHKAAFTDVPPPWSARTFADFQAMAGVSLIAQDHGFALIRTILDEAELLTIAVHPDHQGKGIATILMQDLTDAAKADGATALHLEVAATNVAAVSLYGKSGFVHSGRRRGYYVAEGRAPIDAILLSKAL